MAAMQPESLDILEKAHVPHEQARAFVTAMRIEIGCATETLATKHDVELVHDEVSLVRHEMIEMRQGLELKMEELRGGLQTKVEAVRGDLETKIEAVRGNLETKIETIRGNLEAKIEAVRGSLETKIEAMRGNIVVQLYAAIFGTMTFLVGVTYLLVTHVKN